MPHHRLGIPRTATGVEYRDEATLQRFRLSDLAPDLAYGCPQENHKTHRVNRSAREDALETAIERSTMRKVYLRLLPFAVLSYILAYIDRINVSFAGLTMRGDLNLSATDFGFALGTFFLGYFIFEVPSNVIMEKVGARIWIARIMITWGIFAGAMAFVFDTTSFSIVRFLLGVAEAGFFPGMLLYFTYWFPRKHHARIVSGFLVGLPIAVAFGAPISTGLLSLDGLFGLRGWQIMYIAEAIPTVVIGLLTLIVLTDRPEQATFLNVEEKEWLAANSHPSDG